MRKPTWWDLGIAVLGLFLVCSAGQGMAQQTNPYMYPYGGGTYGGSMAQPAPTADSYSSPGDVTQNSQVTGTPEGLGSTSGLVTAEPQQQTGTGGAGTAGQAPVGSEAAGPPSVDEAQQQVETAQLRTQVARLEQQLAQLREQLAAAQTGVGGSGLEGSGQGGSGVGGSGSAGIGNTNAGAPSTSTGVGSGPSSASGPSPESGGPPPAGSGGPPPESGGPPPEGAGGGGAGTSTGTTTGTSTGTSTGTGSTANRAPENRSNTSNPAYPGYAEALIIYTGHIRSVDSQRLVLEVSGIVKPMPVSPNVHVLKGGKPVSLQSLHEGTPVRVSADMFTKGNPVTEIQVLPVPR